MQRSRRHRTEIEAVTKPAENDAENVPAPWLNVQCTTNVFDAKTVNVALKGGMLEMPMLPARGRAAHGRC